MSTENARKIWSFSRKIMFWAVTSCVLAVLQSIHSSGAEAQERDLLGYVIVAAQVASLAVLLVYTCLYAKATKSQAEDETVHGKYVLSRGHDGWWIIDGEYDPETESSIVATFRPSAWLEARATRKHLNSGDTDEGRPG